jgi:hypothetical protein
LKLIFEIIQLKPSPHSLKILSGYSFGVEAGRVVMGLCKTITREQ